MANYLAIVAATNADSQQVNPKIFLNLDGFASLADGNLTVATNGLLSINSGKIALNPDGSASFATNDIQLGADGSAVLAGSSLTVAADGAITSSSGATFLSNQVQITNAGTDATLIVNQGINDAAIIANSDIYISDTTKGYVLKSPNGTKYRITVNNAGVLQVNAV